jgi:hypothetical protein
MHPGDRDDVGTVVGATKRVPERRPQEVWALRRAAHLEHAGLATARPGHRAGLAPAHLPAPAPRRRDRLGASCSLPVSGRGGAGSRPLWRAGLVPAKRTEAARPRRRHDWPYLCPERWPLRKLGGRRRAPHPAGERSPVHPLVGRRLSGQFRPLPAAVRGSPAPGGGANLSAPGRYTSPSAGPGDHQCSALQERRAVRALGGLDNHLHPSGRRRPLRQADQHPHVHAHPDAHTNSVPHADADASPVAD